MKWEYMVHPTENRYAQSEILFNAMGEKGWELVAVDEGIAYFKRPVETVKIMGIYDRKYYAND